MKICFITENLVAVGGVQRVLSVVANALSEEYNVSILMTSSLNNSHEVSFPLSKGVSVLREEQLSGGKMKYLFPHKMLRYVNKRLVKINDVNIMKKVYFPSKEVVAFNRYFTEHRYDVVIGVQPRAAALVSTLSGNYKKIGWMHSPYDAYFKSPMRWQWRQESMYKEMLSTLDKLVVLTDHDKAQFADELSIKRGQSIVRIYNPLSLTSEHKVNLMNKSGEARLLFVGRLLWNQKGLGELLEVLSHLNEINFHYTLLVVGDGPDRERFLDEAKGLGVNNNIEMCGMKSDVVPYYMQSDILLLTSRWEGFGLVVTEAMECGLPVISFKTEGPKEILSNELSKCLIEKYDTKAFAEKIVELLQNRPYLQELSILAKNRADDFSEKVIIPQWDALLCE